MQGESACVPPYPETISIEIAPDHLVLDDWTVQPDGKINGYLSLGHGEGKPPAFTVSEDSGSARRRLENQHAFGFSMQTQRAWRPVGLVQPLQIANISGTFSIEKDGTFAAFVHGQGDRLSIANGSVLVRQ